MDEKLDQKKLKESLLELQQSIRFLSIFHERHVTLWNDEAGRIYEQCIHDRMNRLTACEQDIKKILAESEG